MCLLDLHRIHMCSNAQRSLLQNYLLLRLHFSLKLRPLKFRHTLLFGGHIALGCRRCGGEARVPNICSSGVEGFGLVAFTLWIRSRWAITFENVFWSAPMSAPAPVSVSVSAPVSVRAYKFVIW